MDIIKLIQPYHNSDYVLFMILYIDHLKIDVGYMVFAPTV